MAISNSKKNPNRHVFAFERNSSKIISNLQSNPMGNFPINLGSQPYNFDEVLKYLSAPNYCFAKLSIIGIVLPLNKISFSTIIIYKTNVLLS